MENKTILKVENILKVYPNGIVANKNVNLDIREGEIHALIGENGAGKSTLMKILFGIETPEEGKIMLNNEYVTIDNPRKAIQLGIGMVHQHFMLVDSLSIAENIILGDEPRRRLFFTDVTQMRKKTQDVAIKYNFDINVDEKVQDVSVGIKQKTEILKALVRGAKILILDEPTAVLTPQETKELFEELKSLKKEGHSIIFISHKLNEIMQICDRVTIMRHGTTVHTCDIHETSPQDISNRMVGREVVLKIEKEDAVVGDTLMTIRDLVYINNIGKKAVKNINFDIKAGKILSIAGVEGNGQAEIAGLLTGLLKPNAGEITIANETKSNIKTSELRAKGLTYIPEDRLTNGCAKELSITENMFTDKIDSFLKKKSPFFDFEKIDKYCNSLIKKFEILCDSGDQSVKMLSGGNMQKVVASRELTDNARIIIAEQPTRGIDAGASELIRRRIIELRDNGSAILLISADLNEILELSDSCMVMYDGNINAYFEDTSNLTEEELGYYMLGVKKQSAEKVRKVYETNDK
jgi:simple sugar transport system ATP-binding protein